MPRCEKCNSSVPESEIVLSKLRPSAPTKRRKQYCRDCYSVFVSSGKRGKRLDKERRGKSRPKAAGDTRGRNYSARAAQLKRLGFKSYREYLASDLWKSVRARVFAVKGRSCFMCGRPATQVHHNRYDLEVLVGKHLKHLIPLCGGCHERIEFVGGEKVSVVMAQSIYRRQRRTHVADEQAKADLLSDPLFAEFRSIAGGEGDG